MIIGTLCLESDIEFHLNSIMITSFHGLPSEIMIVIVLEGLPFPLKVLSCLRILGWNLTFDDAASHARNEGSSLRVFSCNFFREFVKEFGREISYP